jgi:hypothetical protein
VQNYPLFACVLEGRERDAVSSSKKVADSVRLDPWRVGICSICFGSCALFATKIQFASAGIFSSFGPSVCRSMSCPFWVICLCASRLHSDDSLCLNLGWWRRRLKGAKTSQASREGGCGVAGS